MVQTRERAGLASMSNETRGDALRKRMAALGMDKAKLARATGKDRSVISRALDGGAADSTYDQLEVWLDREEAKMGVGLPGTLTVSAAGDEPARKPVTIRMEEGGTIVVQGPLESDDDERRLANLGRELIREWRANRDAPDQ